MQHNQNLDKAQTFSDVFEKIKEETGCQDVEELVSKFGEYNGALRMRRQGCPSACAALGRAPSYALPLRPQWPWRTRTSACSTTSTSLTRRWRSSRSRWPRSRRRSTGTVAR